MHWIYLIHEFHNLSWITEINELFHDILIYWDAPVYSGYVNSVPLTPHQYSVTVVIQDWIAIKVTTDLKRVSLCHFLSFRAFIDSFSLSCFCVFLDFIKMCIEFLNLPLNLPIIFSAFHFDNIYIYIFFSLILIISTISSMGIFVANSQQYIEWVKL